MTWILYLQTCSSNSRLRQLLNRLLSLRRRLLSLPSRPSSWISFKACFAASIFPSSSSSTPPSSPSSGHYQLHKACLLYHVEPAGIVLSYHEFGRRTRSMVYGSF
ncbi:hypothetical protein BJY00DRAFT_290663 [Aspergillus carlsbadensis]|nr:hypothetical protein BJY00DRAFT_290663 [Aspergillus carlsbadensis]